MTEHVSQKGNTADERYQWMNTALGVLVSEFDESVGRAHWWIYAPPDQ